MGTKEYAEMSTAEDAGASLAQGFAEFDPERFLKDVETTWKRHDGLAAAEGYSEDAVLIFGNGQIRRGEELRRWPSSWFEYAKDLQIQKTFRAFSGNCLASEWESSYTHPVSGEVIRERGAEFFFLRPDGKVFRHHMYEHTWVEGRGEDSPWPAASALEK